MSKPLSQEPAKRNDEADVVSDKLKGGRFLTSAVKEFWVLELMNPVEEWFLRKRISPNAITFLGFTLTVIAAIFLGTGHLIWGGWFVIWAGCCDFLDGRIARRSNRQTESGAFLDSVMDRYMDGAVLFGLLAFFRDSWMLIPVCLVILGTFATPYIRAKSESLGIPNSGGEMQRPERIVYVGIGACLSGYYACLAAPFLPAGAVTPPYVLMGSLLLLAVMSNRVALIRFQTAFRFLQSRERARD